MTKEEKENYKKIKEIDRISIRSNAQHTKVNKCCIKKKQLLYIDN